MDVNQTKSFRVPPVAIIGIGCFFPRASGLKAFWHLLYHGKDAIADVPPSHWSPDDYYSEDPRQPDHVYCRRGGFLSPVPFDPTAFGIPPSNLEATDTSQILGLLAAKTALEQAGYGEDARFARDQTAVILGVTGTQELVIPLSSRLSWPQWKRALDAAGVAPEKTEEVMARLSGEYVAWQENSFPGLLGNVVAGRICNRLDLGGTNCVVDAACASSMSALNLALMELYTGRARMAVTGGVDTLNDIFMHMCFARTQILSPSGDARPFSRDADGTVLGEGIGILILKRLVDAEADGDRILAVLKGIGSSSDGKSQSIYAPRAEGQLKALRKAYAAAQVTTDTVDLIEAHGTGTRVGDKIEVQALRELFGPEDTRRHCALGSVKSMIGHTKAAAGAAGLIKAVLALHSKVLPPTLKADIPDPDLELEKSPFFLNGRARPWFRTKDTPRRAGVSAFGFGGSNFHVILEEYTSGRTAVNWDGSVEIVALSAASRAELQSAFHTMRSTLGDCPPETLPHLARQSRMAFESTAPFRLLLILSHEENTTGPRWNTEDVFNEAAPAIEDNADTRHTAASFLGSGDRPGRLVFLFPGQGSQYLHMGRDLVSWFPEALAAMESAAGHFSEELALTDVIYPLSSLGQGPSDQEEALRNTAVAQPAIGALSVAMEKILRRFGLTPEATCGHSYGELTALYSAGWIDEDTLHALSTLRGRLMAAAGGRPGEPNGAMTAVKAPLEKLDRLIAENALDVVLANRNSPNQGILSGDVPSIDKAEAVCKREKLRTIRLPVSAAFHSRLVESAREPFAEAIKSFDIRPTEVPVYSNTTGMAYPGDPAEIRSLLGHHLRNPVDFIGEIENLYADEGRIFVEVGPKTVLSGLVRAILKGRDFHALSVDASNGKKFGILDLAQLLCQLAALGCPINWDEWEAPGEPPPQYKMRIPVRGANFGPSRSSASAYQAVKPRAEASAAKPPLPQPGKVAEPSGAATATSGSSRDRADSNTISEINVQPSDDVNPTPVSNPVNDSQHPVLKALQVVQEGLHSLQALQAQTVEAHQKFLDTQQQASRTLQEMMENSRRFAETILGGHPEAPGTIQPSPADTAQWSSEPTPTAPAPAAKAPVRPVKPDTNDKMAANRSARPPGAGGSGETTGKSQGGGYDSTEVSQTLLAVISELTGYPVDMLAMDMHIETDLGIDSIKRVEILSRVEEKLPGLPPMTPDMIAEFQTIGQVATYLAGPPAEQAFGSDAGDLGAENSPSDQAVPSGTTAALLSVVSELTGYPEDMLSLDMDVESDLGIDSIKRVEILSAMEDRIADFPAVAPDEMAELKTLGQIAGRLQAAGGPLQPVAADAGEDGPSTDASPSDEVHAALMAVVSDLTGYPVEMLSTDMDIETDLGIDSIKRVEILSAMEDRIADFPAVAPDEMAELKTLGQIAAALAGGETFDRPPAHSTATPAVPETNAPAGEPASSVAPLIRRKLTAVEAVHQPTQPLVLPQDRKIFITTDKAGLSHALADQLSARGLPIVQISIDILKHREKLPDAAGLILLCDVEKSDGSAVRAKSFLEDAFALTHHLGPSLQASAAESNAFLATISRMDGTFGIEGLQDQLPHQGGLAGIAKTAAIEWPKVICRALDIDAGWKDNPAIARQVVAELLQPDPAAPVEVGLAPERRVSPGLTPAAPSDHQLDGRLTLEANDVVVISGGARGVTAAAAEALARRCGLTLILLGRSPKPFDEPEWLNGITLESDIKKAVIAHDFASVRPTPQAVEKACRRYKANREIHKNLDRIKTLGADVRYFSLDIRNADRVQAVLNDVRLVHGPIKALIHGAGVLRDRLITEKTPEEFHDVFTTKVDGFENLLAATRDDPLGYIVLFSSVAARFGNVGQVDYAVANEVLNKIAAAEAARRDNCVVRAINWGPWDGGMVDAHLKKVFLEKGIALIPLEKGAEAFVAELEAGDRDGVEVVIGSDLPASRGDQRPTASAIQPANVAAQNNRALSTIFISELNLEHYPILDHHRLDDKPVVPFALMAEWFSHGALHNNPGLQLAGLDDMRLLKGIVLADRQRPIRVLAAPARSNGGGISVDLELRDGLEAGAEVIHSRTTALLTDRLPPPPDFAIPAALQEEGYSHDVAQIYRDILFHGRALQGIQRVRACNAHGMRADLATAPAPTAWIQTPPRNRWIADPLVMDGAFQMASLWCYEEAGRVSLPSYTAAYRQYCRKFPATIIQAVLVVKDVSRYKLVGDFTFLDQEGGVLAEITGYEAVMEDRLMRAFKPQHYATGR